MAIYKTSKRKRYSKIINSKKFILSAGIVLVFLFLLITLLFIPKFRIKNISITKISEQNDEIKKIVQNELNKKTFLIIPKNNIFVLRKKTLIKKIAENIPTIKNVNLNKEFPDTLAVNFEEKQKIGVYCENKPAPENFRGKTDSSDEDQNDTQENCFYIDENGALFGKLTKEEINNQIKNSAYTEFQNTDLQDKKSSAAKNFIKEKTFKALTEFIKITEETLNIKIKKISFGKSSYNIFTSEGWYMIIDENIEEEDMPKIIFENLKLVLDSQIKDKRKKLEYINLRLQNKVFFKLKN